jgi:hypothetical protein
MTGPELARLLRLVADGREEYATSIPEEVANSSLREQRDTLLTEAAAFRSAALLAEGDMSGVWRLLPTWRMTTEVRALMERA